MPTPEVTDAVGQNNRALIDLLKAVRGTEVEYVRSTALTVAHGTEGAVGFAFPGAEFGDFVLGSVEGNTQDCVITGFVDSADNVRLIVQNNSGSDKTFAADTTFHARLIKKALPEVSGANTKNQQVLRDAMQLLVGMQETVTINPASIANRSSQEQTVVVPGARFGMYCLASAERDIDDLGMTAYVSADDQVKIHMYNNTASSVDLAETTFNVRVMPFPDSTQMGGSFKGLNQADLIELLTALNGIHATTTWNPSSVSGAGEQETSITNVTGAEFGDFVLATSSINLNGLSLFGSVTTAGQVTLNLLNHTANSVDLGEMEVDVRVLPRSA